MMKVRTVERPVKNCLNVEYFLLTHVLNFSNPLSEPGKHHLIRIRHCENNICLASELTAYTIYLGMCVCSPLIPPNPSYSRSILLPNLLLPFYNVQALLYALALPQRISTEESHEPDLCLFPCEHAATSVRLTAGGGADRHEWGLLWKAIFSRGRLGKGCMFVLLALSIVTASATNRCSFVESEE